MEMNIIFCFDIFKQIFKIIDFEIVIMPTLKQNLLSAKFQGFFDFFCNGFKRQDVCIFVRLFSVKSTKGTVGDADVGVVDIAINDIGYRFIFFEFFSGQSRCHVSQQ